MLAGLLLTTAQVGWVAQPQVGWASHQTLRYRTGQEAQASCSGPDPDPAQPDWGCSAGVPSACMSMRPVCPVVHSGATGQIQGAGRQASCCPRCVCESNGVCV